jgi:eukaryotic-like serine/threonine-protein kinase
MAAFRRRNEQRRTLIMTTRYRLACVAVATITGLAPLAAAGATAPAAAKTVTKTTTTTVNWPGFHDNAADTGYNASETTLGTGNVSGLTQQWLAATHGTAENVAPTIGAGRLYTSTGEVQAWNASTGALDWTASPAVAVSNLAFGDGRIFGDNGSTGGVYAYNAATGKLDWSFTLPDDGSGSEPVYANGLLYVAGYSSIGAYNPVTGAQVWLSGPPYGGLVRSVPALSDGRLYLAIEEFTPVRHPQDLIAFNASTGALLWAKALGGYGVGGVQTASPVASSDMVYQCSGSSMYGVWAKTGDIRWSEPDGCDNNGTDNTPALANGVLYAASRQSQDVYAINASSGAVEWTAPGEGADAAAPAVANGVVYIPMWADTVAAYDASTGALLWTSPDLGFSVGVEGAQPAVVNGLLYMGGAGGVYAFGLST